MNLEQRAKYLEKGKSQLQHEHSLPVLSGAGDILLMWYVF